MQYFTEMFDLSFFFYVSWHPARESRTKFDLWFWINDETYWLFLNLLYAGLSYTGHDGIVTGWGVTKQGGQVSDTLQEVKVPIMSNSECKKTKYGEKRITNNMLCAGYPKGEKDSCQVTQTTFNFLIEEPRFFDSLRQGDKISWKRKFWNRTGNISWDFKNVWKILNNTGSFSSFVTFSYFCVLECGLHTLAPEE